ncbi:MAG: flagellar hook protein FlgE [Beijerinckiaceae bacterium]
MSLFDAMRTGISGMNAQSTKIGMVAENIANSSTTGYKKGGVEFETVLVNAAANGYTSGSVATHMRYDLTQQGSLSTTTSVTDLAIQGDGFFVVTTMDGAKLLTRAGAFVPDSSGQLVNSAGYALMGYPISDGQQPVTTLAGLSVVTLPTATLKSAPSTQGFIAANIPSGAAIVAGAQLPSSNGANASWSAKTSVIAYDNLGAAVTLDVYFTKTADNTWEAAFFDRSVATNNGFPYASGPLATAPLSFDPATGRLTAPALVALTVPNGQAATIDLSDVTQLAANFTPYEAQMNGSAPVRSSRLEVGTDGLVSTVYEDGSRVASYRIPLANVVSPNQLTPVTGNAYAESVDSGSILLGTAHEGGFGKIISSSLENSTVDLATELTTMIEAQRGYTANSKVFQASSDLIETLLRI